MKQVKLAFALVGILQIQASAQVTPGAIRIAEMLLENDPTYEANQNYHRTVERSARALFQELPPIFLIANDLTDLTNPIPLWQKDRIELQLRQSGIEIAADQKGTHVKLVANVCRNGGGTWGVVFQLQEDVLLNRPGVPRMERVVTYENDIEREPTRQDAEKRLEEAVNDFCLLYMRYSK